MSKTTVKRGRLSGLANPTRFLSFTQRLVPIMTGTTVVLFAFGLYFSFSSEGDYQQGDTVRIMYIHVPAAWASMMCYMLMAVAALGTLVWRHPLADVAHKSAAPIGAAFTLLALLTGSLWGRPMWGAWWVWDARLTSVFILFLMYLGIMALHRAVDEPTRAARLAAILILVGVVNIPIIKFSVNWWNTLHQPASVLRLNGPAIDPEFMRPLLIMALAYSFTFFTMHLVAMRNEVFRRRIAAMRKIAAIRMEKSAAVKPKHIQVK